MPADIIASAPTRLDFGGGWTDVPPFPEERGGFVCSLAIERRAVMRLIDPAPTNPASGGTSGSGGTPASGGLIAAALRRADAEQLYVSSTSDFPVGAGLGGSSAAGVALAAALAAWRHESLPPAALAEWSRAVEVEEMRIAGGRQDHYAAAFGGALGLTFTEASTDVEVLPVADDTLRALETRCLLAYTGESRISGRTITAVIDAYVARVPRVVAALERMKALAYDMRQALMHGRLDDLAALVDEHWVHQASLHPEITTPRIEALAAAARRAGAVGIKALGASGGGCVMIFTPADGAEAVAAAAAEYAELLPWRAASRGVALTVIPSTAA